jgi:pimeloyl-ACP methyl ester carboxylesterase
VPKTWFPSARALSLLLAGIGHPLPAQVSRYPADPVTTDPSLVDPRYPLGSAELAFDSEGSRLNGFFYLAGGKGAHPAVILLHGFPGNERNGDLAQALRRAGMHVLVFSYRGAWGSGGTFSFAHALEDVAAAIRFVRSDSSIAAFRIDPHRIILAGHSMGGWLALMGAAADSTVACSVALDFWNVGADGRRTADRREPDSSLVAYATWLTAPGGPLHAESVPALIAEITEHADLWDPDRRAASLSPRPLLLISSTHNEAHPGLVAALHAAHARHLKAIQWTTDHGFSARRIQLARTVVGWLRDQCGT